ncbi:MAG: PrgI family protein, partial [Candidatus Woesearchaeota archaeon]|nr:PrgI family protein [Candidatus Woesearchaeota archaeon]
MTYEIPQQIAYEEKIIFGLTFRQLIYVLIFGPIALAILFKTPFDIYTRVALALIPSSICAVFIFTKIPALAIDYIRWLFNREYHLMDVKMKQWLNLKEINGSVVELYDKKLSIIMVEPINFAIKNQKEKELIISSFQKFLNSLDFFVQIVVATDTINFDIYMNELEKRVSDVETKTGNENYTKLFEGYKKHLNETISKNSLMNRSFYLVVPEDQKIGLNIQVDVCKQLLKNLDLRHELLKSEELENVLSEFFNDLYEDDKKQALLKRPLRQNEQLHYSVAPPYFIN